MSIILANTAFAIDNTKIANRYYTFKIDKKLVSKNYGFSYKLKPLMTELSSTSTKYYNVSKNKSKIDKCDVDIVASKLVAIQEIAGAAKAQEALQRIIKLCPKQHKLKAILAYMYLENNYLNKASKAIIEALENDKNNFEYKMLYLDILMSNNKIADAREIIRLIKDRDIKDLLLVNALKMRKARLFDLTGKTDKALQEINEVLKNNGNNIAALAYKAKLLREKMAINEAWVVISKAVQLEPNNGYLVSIFSEILFIKIQHDIDLGYKRIIANKNDEEAYIMVARSYHLNEQSMNAFEVLLNGATENPNSTKIWMMIGALEILSLRYKEASAVFREVTRIDAKNATANNNLAYLLLYHYPKTENNRNKAILYSKRATTLAPDNVVFLETLAEALYQQGNNQKAISTIEKALQLAPKKKFLHHQLSRYKREL